MRCRCCNVPLTWRNFKMKQDNGLEEDFCSACLNIVYNIDEYEVRKYAFEEITERFYSEEVTQPKTIDY